MLKFSGSMCKISFHNALLEMENYVKAISSFVIC